MRLLERCIFVGYDANQGGYRCFSPILKKMLSLYGLMFCTTGHTSPIFLGANSERKFLNCYNLMFEFVHDVAVKLVRAGQRKKRGVNFRFFYMFLQFLAWML